MAEYIYGCIKGNDKHELSESFFGWKMFYQFPAGWWVLTHVEGLYVLFVKNIAYTDELPRCRETEIFFKSVYSIIL